MLRLLKNFLHLFTGKPEYIHKPGDYKTIDLIFNRRTCRSFTDEEISPDELYTILEAGRFAPSTVNLQTWSFITFTKEEWQNRFERPIPFKGSNAIVVCADTYRLKDVLVEFKETPVINFSFAIFNAGLAAMNMTIAAEALGIKSIMLSETGKTGLLDYAWLKDTLNLPDGVLPLTTLVLGKEGTRMPGIPPRQPRAAVVMRTTYDHRAGTQLQDWFEQMFIGFKMTHPMSSFAKQIDMYKTKMTDAEKAIAQQFSRKGKQ